MIREWDENFRTSRLPPCIVPEYALRNCYHAGRCRRSRESPLKDTDQLWNCIIRKEDSFIQKLIIAEQLNNNFFGHYIKIIQIGDFISGWKNVYFREEMSGVSLL